MHLATTLRAAHGWRLGTATLILSSALTFGLTLQPTVAHAQSGIPTYIPTGRGNTVPSLVEHDLAPAQSATTPSATTPSATTPSDTATEVIHEIAVGDTLSNVAQRYNVTPADLATYNQILDHNHIMIGQKLRIPPSGATITEPAESIEPALPGAEGYHVVRIGESLSAIAQLYQLTLDELMELNEIENPNLVNMGTMLRVTGEVEPASKVIEPEETVITYTVHPGDSLDDIAKANYTTVAAIMHDNNLTTEELRIGQQLQIHPPATALEAFGVDAPIDGERKIVIDLSDQTLTAYQGDVRVLHSIVSTGKAATPTIPGEFAIYLKYKSQHMTGDDYDLPGVPWVMYYYDEYAIHGAYWHANFGVPTSHGCTNMTIPESKAIYSWAPLGTRVIVQE